MCEFRNLLNTFATHVTADNVESFITFTEHLITLGASLAAGSTNPVAAAVEVLTDVNSVVKAVDSASPSNP